MTDAHVTDAVHSAVQPSAGDLATEPVIKPEVRPAMEPDRAISLGRQTGTCSWDSKDVLLYHLGLGIGRQGLDDRALHYLYERDLHVLPTFGVVAAAVHTPYRLDRVPGLTLDLQRILHTQQDLVVHGAIPASGTALVEYDIVDVYDTGSAALITFSTLLSDPETGAPLATSTATLLQRGSGGFGGRPAPGPPAPPPADRAPDLVLEVPTWLDQAAVYRLSGDANPLHIDPDFARAAGLQQPILHGLCTYGIVAHALVEHLAGGRVGALRALSARFSRPVVPGELLRLSCHIDTADNGDRLVHVEASTASSDAPVLKSTRARLAAV